MTDACVVWLRSRRDPRFLQLYPCGENHKCMRRLMEEQLRWLSK